MKMAPGGAPSRWGRPAAQGPAAPWRARAPPLGSQAHPKPAVIQKKAAPARGATCERAYPVPSFQGTANLGRLTMDAGVGWIAAIIIGGVAGWLAEQFMKSDMGLLMNIVLGIVGAAIASAILSMFGIVLGGWVGYLICGFI